MINSDHIFIIIPVYNEAKPVKEVIAELLRRGYLNIIVIDDGSTENILYQISHLPIIFMRHRVNLGQGAALQTGLTFARKKGAQIVITFDADGQHCADDIEKLIAPIATSNADIVIGSRFMKSDNSSMPLTRKMILQSARFVNLLFSGILLSDAHNGLRAMNQKAINAIQISENRMAHASEILFEIKRHQLKCTEVPVNISYTEASMKKGQSSIDSIRILFDLVLHKLFK
jgi:glycosyltransferase involved in cell wall biosynthesis